jgi:hypothetical protein
MRDAFLLLLVFVAVLALGTLGLRLRFAWLGKERRAAGSRHESFRSELGSRVSGEVSRTVYDFFYDSTGKRMPVLASDDLGDVYGIVDEDLVDELRELAVKCRVTAPNTEEIFLVSTVLEAALLMESLRQREGREPG